MLVLQDRPIFCGKMASSSSWFSIQSMRYSTYFGADTSSGFLIVTPSAHRYSYLPRKTICVTLGPNAPTDCSRQSSLVTQSTEIRIGEVVSILGTCRHCWAILWSTKLCQCAEEHVDLVEKIDSCNHTVRSGRPSASQTKKNMPATSRRTNLKENTHYSQRAIRKDLPPVVAELLPSNYHYQV